MTRLLFAAAACAGLAAPAGAALADPRVGGLIEKLPADTAAESERVFGELSRMGEAGVKALADLLADPETGGDAPVRYALHGLALRAGRPGADSERAAFARAVVAQVGPGRPVDANRFLLRLLVHAGGLECAETLGRFVADPELGEAACLSLVQIGAGGGAALRAALLRVEGRNRRHVIQALGELRDRRAVPLLIPIAAASGEEQEAALLALGDIGDAAAEETIRTAAGSAPGYAGTVATTALITLARRMNEAGEKDAARDVYRRIIDGGGEAQAVSAALKGLAEVDGGKAMPEVARAQLADDPELVAAATAVAAAAGGGEVTRWWIERAEKGEPAARAGALKVLGGRNDDAAVAAVAAALEEKDRAVRLAAISAAGGLRRTALVRPLVAVLASDDAEERRSVRDALLGMPRGSGSAALAGELKGATPPVRARLIEILGSRGATEYGEAVAGYLDDPAPEVRTAALEATGVLCGREAVSRVVARAIVTGEESERKAAAGAFAGICRREVEPEPCAAPVLAALLEAGAPARACLLGMLSDAGGAAALAAVRERLRDESGEVREAAVRALADWPSDDAAPDLLEIAGSEGEEVRLRVLALRGYVRQIEDKREWWAKGTVERLAAALKAAPRAEDRIKVLSAIGKIRLPVAMEVAETALADEACRAEAGAAIVRIALETYAGRLDETIATLERLLKSVDDETVRKKAKEALDLLKEKGDYVTLWKVSGPYEEPSATLDELVDFEFEPEKVGNEAGWWRMWGWRNRRTPGRVSVEAGYVGNCAAYLRTYVWSPEAGPARMEVGSNDHVKVWLNGEVTHVSRLRTGQDFGEEEAKVKLREGWNEVILKATQRTGDSDVSLRFRSSRGRRLKGLKAAAALPGEGEDEEE